jgi:hypothetical protein
MTGVGQTAHDLTKNATSSKLAARFCVPYFHLLPNLKR